MTGARGDQDQVTVQIIWLPGSTAIMLPVSEEAARRTLSEAFYNLMHRLGLTFAIPDIQEHCEWLAEHTLLALSFTDEEIPI